MKFLKSLSLVMAITMIFSVILPVSIAFAAVPTLTLSHNGTTITTSAEYKILGGQTVTLTASHSSGIKAIYYRLGTGSLVTVNAATASITIPTSLNDTGIHTINTYALANDNTYTNWQQYSLRPVSSLTSTTRPVVTASTNGTAMTAGSTYNLPVGQTVTVSATHSSGVKSITYRLGTNDLVTVNGGSATISIPSTFTNAGQFSLNIYATANDGNTSLWQQYLLEVKSTTTGGTTTTSGRPVVTASTNGTAMTAGSTYNLAVGQTVAIAATQTSGVKSITYRLGTNDLVTVNGGSTTISIPSNFTNAGQFSLNVYATANDGNTSLWQQYILEVKSTTTGGTTTTSGRPVVTVSTAGAAINTGSLYNLAVGQTVTVNATHTSGIKTITYRLGTNDLVTVNGGSATISIPSNFTNAGQFSLNVYATANDSTSTSSLWQQYILEVKSTTTGGTTTIVRPVVTVTHAGAAINVGSLYNVPVGESITVNATHTSGIKTITYRLGTNDLVTVNGGSATISIPSNFTNAGQFSLNVYATANDSTSTSSLWQQYILEVKSTTGGTTTTTDRPVAKMTLNGVEIAPNTNYVINKNDVLQITGTHTNGVNQVVYRLGTLEVTTVTGSMATLAIPTNFVNAGPFSVNMYVTANNGYSSLWQQYVFEIKDSGSSNNKFSISFQQDEVVNTAVNSLEVALRNISTKVGNKNILALNEQVQYNIDFVNGGSSVTDDVTIQFSIPQNLQVEFVDTKSATVINPTTVQWTIKGLESGAKGTIPVTLKYTSLNGLQYEKVKPIVTLKTGSVQVTSAVENYVYENSNVTVLTNHAPYMIGDAGTNTFRPTEGLNRAEMAMILVRIFGLQLEPLSTVSYADKEAIAHDQFRWSTQAILTVTKAGLMKGYEDNTFRPAEKVTKAQLITIIARRFEVNNTSENNAFKIKAKPIKAFNMNTSHWAAPEISQLMRLNMLSDVLKVNDNVDQVITRGEVTNLINTCLFRGPSSEQNSGTVANSFKDVNASTQNYSHIIEASANIHNSKFTSEGKEVMVK